MPSYSYTAINDAGIKKKGILSADSEREARKLVKDLKLTPLKISESKNFIVKQSLLEFFYNGIHLYLGKEHTS